jgi:hypothetical protein
MIALYSQIKDRALALNDDPGQSIYKDPIVLAAMGEALDALTNAFEFYEIPKLKVLTTFTVMPGTTHVSPADLGIADFGQLIWMRERRLGANTEIYTHIWEVDDLSQRPAVELLGEFEYRGDEFWFIGTTGARQVQMAYFSSNTEAADFNGTSGVDSSLTFLAKYTAAIMGRRKDDSNADRYMQEAVGSRYADGVIGGELFRICQPRVRGRQRVQCAPKPYSVVRRRYQWWRPPYVAANFPNGGIGEPAVFDTVNGTITPLPDGSNLEFFLSYPVSAITLERNGSVLTDPVDYSYAGGRILFTSFQTPGVGDNLRAEGWGSTSPGTPTVIVTPPPGFTFVDPVEPIDGINSHFTFTGTPTAVVYNGLWQFNGVGYTLDGITRNIVTLIDSLGNPITPAVGDTLKGVF